MDENDIMGFAMSLSMASALSRVMGQTMQTAVAPQVAKPDIFILVDGKKYGPYTMENITSFIREGNVTGETCIWKPGMSDWVKIKDLISNR